jgi:hypothetical protein
MNAALNANENDEADSYRELLPDNRRFAAPVVGEFCDGSKESRQTIVAPKVLWSVSFCAEWAENDPRLRATVF